MPHVQSADRVVATVQATESGDWQVLSVPVGFQGISATRFADNDLVGGFVLFEDGVNFEVYDGDVADNFLEILNVAGTPTLARPSDANILVSSNNDNRVAAGSGSHTLVLCQGGASFARFLRETNPTWKTFTSGDATPSVAGFRHFKTNGTTAITQFDDMAPGQLFRVRRNGSDITLTYAADKIILPGLVDLTLTADEPVATFINDGGVARWVGGGLSKASLLSVPNVYPSTELTIASGAITPTRASHSVDTEGDAATDDLATVTATNLQAGDVVLLTRNNSARTPIVKHGTGNVALSRNRDLRLGVSRKALALFYDGTTFNDLLWQAEDGIHNIIDYGAVAGSTGAAAANVTAIKAAIVAQQASGGVVYFPPGTWYVTRDGSAGSLWIEDAAIHITDDNVRIEGAGIGQTTVALTDDSDCYVFAVGTRGNDSPAVTNVPVDNVSIRHMTVDGNGSNQRAATVDDYHWAAIEIAEGSTNATIDNVHVKNGMYYGIGVQRDGVKFSTISNCIVEDSGADGIDWKNDNSAGVGNTIFNVRIRRWGLHNGWHSLTGGSKVVTDQAGLDIRSGVSWSHIYIDDYGTSDEALTGIRCSRDVDSDFATKHGQTGTHFYVNGDDGSGTVGVRIDALRFSLAHGHIENCGKGLRVTQRENNFSDIDISSCTTGLEVGTGSNGTNGDNNNFDNIDIRDCSGTGIDVLTGVTGNNFIACDSRGNGTGVAIAAGATNTRFLMGSVTSNTTDVSDSSDDTIFLEVSGVDNALVMTDGRLFTDKARLFDEFDGTLNGDKWTTSVGTDPQATAATVTGGTDGGILRLVAGDDAAGTYAVNGSQLHGKSNYWDVGKGGFVFRARVALRSSGGTYPPVFIGLTGDTGLLEMPFTLGASNALTNNLTNGFGFVFDPAADDDNWWAVGSKAGSATSRQTDTGTAPDDFTFQVFEIRVNTSGSAQFFIDGTLEATIADITTVGSQFTPTINVFSRTTNASQGVDVDFILVEQNR